MKPTAAERSNCERRDSSLSEKSTAVPAVSSMKMNSSGKVATTEQSSTSMAKMKNAARES